MSTNWRWMRHNYEHVNTLYTLTQWSTKCIYTETGRTLKTTKLAPPCLLQQRWHHLAFSYKQPPPLSPVLVVLLMVLTYPGTDRKTPPLTPGSHIYEASLWMTTENRQNIINKNEVWTSVQTTTEYSKYKRGQNIVRITETRPVFLCFKWSYFAVLLCYLVLKNL